MDKKELRVLSKLRKKVARLRKRGKQAEAIDVQREVCDRLAREPGEWQILATICKEAGQLQLSLAARFEAAKIARSGPDEWVALAEEALDWGFEADSIEARFRAADGCAVAGDFRRAMRLLEEVLAFDPNHRQAQRIRRLVASRLPAEEEHAEQIDTKARTTTLDPNALEPGEEPEELSGIRDTMSFVEHSEISRVPAAAERSELLLEEVTSPGWEAPSIDLGSEQDPTPAGYVCAVQPWPSVLDSRTLTFIGSTEVFGEELRGLTEAIVVAEGAPVYLQGHAGQLLYCLDSGTISFARERGETHALGEITPGHFFGELGALMGLPSTATASAVESSLLRVVSRKQIQRQVEETKKVPPLISMLRSWYLETVLRICPLFLGGDEPSWPEGDDVTWITVRPGDELTALGATGPLHVIVTGFAKIVLPGDDGPSILGYLCPGDLCGELDPSPVQVLAESVVTALRLPRHFVDALPQEARSAFEERQAHCQTAVEIPAAAGIIGDVVLTADDLNREARPPDDDEDLTAAADTGAAAVDDANDNDTPTGFGERGKDHEGGDDEAGTR